MEAKGHPAVDAEYLWWGRGWGKQGVEHHSFPCLRFLSQVREKVCGLAGGGWLRLGSDSTGNVCCSP